MKPLLLVVCALLLLPGCGTDEDSASSTPEPTPTATASPEAGCEKVAAPKPKPEGELRRPRLALDAKRTYSATVTTSCGSFTIELDVKRAPRTSASFASLARKGFFAKTIFHRIVPDFVIQGGDPTGTGTGGPGYSVEEAPPADLAYSEGVVAMAKTGAEAPGTSGSQFYVVTGDAVELPPEYALLGKVTTGLEVVKAIGSVPTGPDDRPIDPVVIDSVKITEG